MRSADFDECIAAACRIAGLSRVVVFGSQSVLGHAHDSRLPPEATRSREVDLSTEFHAQGVASAVHDEALHAIDARLGEGSAWDRNRGYYVEAVDIRVAVLPVNWEHRLTRYVASGAAGEGIALCLSMEDACASKLMRLEGKDRRFVAALVDGGLVGPGVIEGLLDGEFVTGKGYDRTMLPVARRRALAFVATLSR